MRRRSKRVLVADERKRTRDEVDTHHQKHFSRFELKELVLLKSDVSYYMS